MIDEKLNRLITALESRGYKKHGRATALKAQTGYAISTISEVLKGSADLTERFTKIVCSAAGVSFDWVWFEKGGMLTEERHYSSDSNFKQLSGANSENDGTPINQTSEMSERLVDFSPDLKLISDSIEIQLQGKTAEERAEFIKGVMAAIWGKGK